MYIIRNAVVCCSQRYDRGMGGLGFRHLQDANSGDIMPKVNVVFCD